MLLLKSKTSWDPILDTVLKTGRASCVQCFLTNFTGMVATLTWYRTCPGIPFQTRPTKVTTDNSKDDMVKVL